MRKAGIFLCGIAAAVFMTGCGAEVPELTEEETETISEYARSEERRVGKECL